MENANPTNWVLSPILIFIFGFGFGILISSFVFVSPIISTFIILIGGGILLSEKIYNREVGREVLLLSLVFLSFGLGSLRYAVKDFHDPITPSSRGVVTSEPEEKENSKRFVFQSDNGEKALVYVPLYDSIGYGDEIEINGRFERPGVIVDEVSG